MTSIVEYVISVMFIKCLLIINLYCQLTVLVLLTYYIYIFA